MSSVFEKHNKMLQRQKIKRRNENKLKTKKTQKVREGKKKAYKENIDEARQEKD